MTFAAATPFSSSPPSRAISLWWKSCVPSRRGTDRSLAELAIAWVLRRPEVTAAIVGGRRPGQVRDIAGAADWDLSPADAAEIESLIAETGAGRAG